MTGSVRDNGRMAKDETPKGLTKDAGWEIGVSRTFPVPLEHAWDFLTSPAGARLWLGDGATVPTEKGEPIVSAAGGEGELRSLRRKDRVRLRWKAPGWDHETVVQIAVRGDETKTSIRFHQEWLANAEEREQQRAHWSSVLDQVEKAL
jgi:uncharacterized protein YndB with AHSA1/START domain